jgi:hypothetical protein
MNSINIEETINANPQVSPRFFVVASRANHSSQRTNESTACALRRNMAVSREIWIETAVQLDWNKLREPLDQNELLQRRSMGYSVTPPSRAAIARHSIYGEVAYRPEDVSSVRHHARNFEDFYQRIGWRKGPYGSREAQKSVREFWVGQGAAGARWLVERLARETHVDVLDGAANLLADIGPKSIEPIASSLEYQPTRDHAEVLLKALGWIEAPQDVLAIQLDHLVRTLARYLAHTDADIRAAASAATRILPPDRAIALLARRRESESDPGVLEAIDEACDR